MSKSKVHIIVLYAIIVFMQIKGCHWTMLYPKYSPVSAIKKLEQGEVVAGSRTLAAGGVYAYDGYNFENKAGGFYARTIIYNGGDVLLLHYKDYKFIMAERIALDFPKEELGNRYKIYFCDKESMVDFYKEFPEYLVRQE